jgi:hypothetical protein
MCMGGGSKGNTAAPPPSQPTMFQYRTSETDDQRRANRAVADAQAPVVMSTTTNQGPAAPGSFGSELATGGM